MIAQITPTNIPGLYDIRCEDGQEFRDITTNQTTQLIADLDLRPANPNQSHEEQND